MERMWRLLAHYRYLLLACLVLALGVATSCLLGPPPSSRSTTASAPPLLLVSLRDRYRQIQVGMTRAQALKVLGQPKTVFDPGHDIAILCTWREGRDTAAVFFGSWGDYPVLSIRFLEDGVEAD
jgi:hypothetical protein